MESVILVIHLFLALAIIGLVLLQRSEGGGLGIGGNSGGGAGSFASARGTANFLTRMTGICAGAFFVTSLVLVILAGQHTKGRTGILSVLDDADIAPISAPLEGAADSAETGVNEADQSVPSAPIAQ